MMSGNPITKSNSSFGELPSTGFVRMKALLPPHGPIPASRATIYAWIRAGVFPSPVSIGTGRIKGFRVEDVRAFLQHPSTAQPNGRQANSIKPSMSRDR